MARKKEDEIAPVTERKSVERHGAAPEGLPSSFEPEESYNAIVTEQFVINGFVVNPGSAILSGEAADQFRDKLSAAWKLEE